MNELAIKIEHVSKEYRLGTIGGGTLKGDLQSWWARKRGQEDPNSKIGSVTKGHIGDRFLALDDINLEVKKGEALGIIGHNGAGKSTLLKLLSRVTAPSTGTISINGRIASMLEVGTGFHPELTGRENVYMNGAILGMTKAEITKKFDEIVAFAEMEKFIDTPVKRYSSGMYVKLAFSVASHLDSEIMIMDEVLAVGDLAFQKKCLDKMREAAKADGRTVLYVSHNMNTIRQLCDRCVVLDHGKIIFDGEVENAISIYMNSRKNCDTFISYDNYCRPGWLKHRLIKVLSAEFSGKKNAVFDCSETMSILLHWKNIYDVNDLCLRLEVWTLDDVAQASYVLNSFYSGKASEHVICNVELDISQFMQSDYKFFFTFFHKDQFGNNEDIDCVPGLGFEINTISSNSRESIVWKPKNWGYIKMPDSAIISHTIRDESIGE